MLYIGIAVIFLSPSPIRASEVSPILFLPGIFGSRLYVVESDGSQEKIWDGFAGDRMRRLAMDENGKSIEEVQVGSVLEYFSALSFNFINIYGSLKRNFECYFPAASSAPKHQYFATISLDDIPGNFIEEEDCGPEFVTYPYDWRYDVFDIVDNGTTYISGEHVNLIELVQKLANNPTGKVNILAHSNGGLLAKALMVRLEEQDLANLIDKIILVGSPQVGTPKTIPAMLHGYEQGQLKGFIKNEVVSRKISLNSPGAYGLLPSAAYFSNIENKPTVSFDTSSAAAPYRNIFGETIDTYAELVSFLSDSSNLRTQPSDHDLRSPSILGGRLLSKAARTHAQIDAWVPPEGTEFIQIAGVGNSTVTGVEYSTKKVTLEPLGIGSLLAQRKAVLYYKPITSLYGDSEVVGSSSGNSEGDVYYFDFKKLKDETSRNKKHLDFLTETEVLKSIEELLQEKPITSIYASKDRPVLEEGSTLAISVHSPVLISARDSSGNITSISYDEDLDLFKTITKIPGSSVEFIDEGKYIFLPDGNYSITVTGLDVGSFDLVLSNIDSTGRLQEVNRLSNIPTTASSIGKTAITSDSISALSLDLDGNGSSDFSFSDESSNTEAIATSLKDSFASLPLRPELHLALRKYFMLLETATDESKKVNYVSQIKRIIRFINGRYVTQDTANEWTALVDNLQ